MSKLVSVKWEDAAIVAAQNCNRRREQRCLKYIFG